MAPRVANWPPKFDGILFPALGPILGGKALPGFFLCILSSLDPYLPEETCFQQAGYYMVEGISQAVLGSSDERKVPSSLSLFLKSEKIPALLYKGKGPEYRPFRNFRRVPPASDTDLKSRKGLHSGPSPINKVQHLLVLGAQ